MNTSTDDRKKVLLTVNNNRLSGIERFTLLLAEYMDKSRYIVEVAVPTYGPFCEILRDKNIEYFVFNNKINERYTLSGIKFLFNRIYKKKYDIIHAQAGIAPCIIGKILGTNLIIEHKHGLDFTSEQIDKMNPIRLNYEKLKKYFVDVTCTVCESDKIILKNRFKYNSGKVVVIYNGLETAEPRAEIQKNNKFTIGTIGRLTYQKGQEYFIEMAKDLLSKGYKFEFHIYGEGEKHCEYQELINKYNLSESVFLKGYTKNVSDALKSFDLFVLPSRYEGIPYVILEVMNYSIPLISTNVGGISEVITNNVNGFLTEKENVSELADKTIMLYESKKIRKNITENARKTFLEKYTIEKTVKSVESLYSSFNSQFKK